MSTLVQHNNSPHYPQSTIMNNGGDSSIRQQRPTHNPSKNLLQNELQCLYDTLGQNRVTLATAVAQIFHGYNGTWRKQACGVFCFVKDYDHRTYCFRLYDLKSRQSIYEEAVPASLRLEKAMDLFYTFDGSNCKIGISFVDRDEAQTFSHHFHSKQEDRQKKKKGNAPIKTPPPPATIQQQPMPSVAMSTMMNGIKPPTSIVTQPVAPPAPVTTQKKPAAKKNPGYFTLGRKTKARPDISAPIQSTLVHVGHIGTNESFFNDDTQKQMFEQVLAGLHISPEDKLYVRELVNTDGGLEKLLAKTAAPVRDHNNQGSQQQQMSSGPPVIPPRSYQTIGRNNDNRAPHQDISTPSSSHNQSSNSRLQGLFIPPPVQNQQAAPIIPPRPGPRVPDNTCPPMQAPPPPPPPPPPPMQGGFFTESTRAPAPPAPPPPPPPPPLPTGFWNQSQSSNGPPPPAPPLPPPAPPAPLLSSGPLTHTPPTSAAAGSRDDLLGDIRKFSTTKLKQRTERPALPEVSSANESSPGAQDTMAMNILKILAERREKLIGPEHEDDSDSSEGEWSN